MRVSIWAVVRVLCRALEAGCACERLSIGAVGRVLCTAFEAVCACERVSIGAVVLVLCTAFRSMEVALGSACRLGCCCK